MKNIFLFFCCSNAFLHSMEPAGIEKNSFFNKNLLVAGLHGAALGITRHVIHDFLRSNCVAVQNIFFGDFKKKLIKKVACDIYKTFLLGSLNVIKKGCFDSCAAMMHKVEKSALFFITRNGFECANKVIAAHQWDVGSCLHRALPYGFFGCCVGMILWTLYSLVHKYKNDDARNQPHVFFNPPDANVSGGSLYDLCKNSGKYGIRAGVVQGFIGASLLYNVYAFGCDVTGFTLTSARSCIMPLLVCFGAGFAAGGIEGACFFH